MAQTKLGGSTVNTNGTLPVAGSAAPDFSLTGVDLKEVSLKNYEGKNIVMNIFPSIDTNVCAASVREFNKAVAAIDNTIVLSISKDLPFAMKRFCGVEGINKIAMLSDFKAKGFSESYGVEMTDGRLNGLFARAVVVIAPDGKIKYSELVSSIDDEPDYEAALAVL
ncbi:MAG: thiol peroxidase [Cyclobacteriaceae bacterium]|nr:thiol peroxidase [Cyclobacteriaceae bacterium]